MQYLKTIRITDQLIALIHAGKLQLQAGQWIQLDWSDSPSRYAGITQAGVIYASHCYKVGSKNRLDGGMPKFQKLCAAVSRIQKRDVQS